MMSSVMIDIIHAYTITFVQTFEFFTNIYIFTIIIYSHSKFYNNWLKTYCHQSWLTSFMHAQSHLCKHLIFLLIYIFSLSLYTHIPNFITIGRKHDVISHDWHHSCIHNHVCAKIWVFLLISIFAQSLYTHIPNFIAIGWKHDVISHDWHHSCMHNHVCANIWVFFTNIYICTIIIYSLSKFHNNWLKTWCHQLWLTSFMYAQSRLWKYLSFLLIYIYLHNHYILTIQIS